MAFRVFSITVVVPAGTLLTSPLSTPWVTEDNTIVSIEIEIPPGHNGQTGIRLLKGDVQILPFGSNSWIIANDTDKTFPIGSYVPTGDLIIQTYNTGIYSHSFYLRMTTETYVPAPSTPNATEASALDLGAASSSADPLSPDAVLGPGTAAALTAGDVTAADIAPVDLTTMSGGGT